MLVFEVYQTQTHAWHIELGKIAVGASRSFQVTVECTEKAGTFVIAYYLEISGPKTLNNDYLTLKWQDTDGAAFTIGRSGSQTFSGTGTLTWKSSQIPFAAGHKNNITLTLTFLTMAAIGKYSMNMWVAFTPRLSVTISPSSTTLDVGQSQWFTSNVTDGSSPCSYQWYLNGALVSGATKPAWKFTPTSAGSYMVYVKVNNSVGMQATSNTAAVTVNAAPSVTILPNSFTLDVGLSQLFTSSVTGGTSPYTYCWYLDGRSVSSHGNSTWTFTPTSAGFYTVYVKVTDSLGIQATSNVANVTVNSRLSVSISPTSADMKVGESKLFTSTVSSGTSPYSYQWYLDGTVVSGAKSSTWTFTPKSSGSYTIYLKVTDSLGIQATSNTAVADVKSK
jgi:hypothetical protein